MGGHFVPTALKSFLSLLLGGVGLVPEAREEIVKQQAVAGDDDLERRRIGTSGKADHHVRHVTNNHHKLRLKTFV